MGAEHRSLQQRGGMRAPGGQQHGSGHHHGAGDTTEHHAGTSFSYVITNLVQEQRRQGVWSDTSFRVTLVVGGHREEGAPSVQAAASATPPPALVHIGSVSITAE